MAFDSNTATPPRVGVGVFVYHGDGSPEFIIGQRKGSHGAGTFALPGGHLEHGESFEECAAREILEETGLVIDKVKFLTATNSVFHDTRKHYVTIFMTAVARSSDGGSSTIEPELIEPDKCEGWTWTTFNDMNQKYGGQQSLFLPLLDLVKQRPDICQTLGSRGML
ncbi:hypothetical protein K431DRAFT_284184 [Polychaeton citri CBS 116435]|uniref:Nudix hydrolase domain-containing protein n=1 Tax=Polychaeton citri CBS 116435 TaxID=1314669 RepID=A0A9P4UPX3_9PEZI|nr:hypothetical protein K431DRAFT_284184 [Polychaeton citri CBS 116435]